MATYRDAAVNLMRQLATSGRSYVWGGGHSWTNLQTVNVLGKSVQVPAGGMDCSGAVLNVYKALGIIDKYGDNDTGTMSDYLCARGFIYHPWEDEYTMRPGDLALRPKNTGTAYGHVAMCVADDFTLAEFTTASAGGPGVRPFYNYPWTICLELPDSIGNRTWSGGSSTTGDPRYTWSQHNVYGQEELARDRMRLYGWDSAVADGICGVDTQTDIVAVWQQSLNDDFPNPPIIAVDGWLDAETRVCIDYHTIYAGVWGNQALMAKYALWFNGYNTDLSNWDFTATDQAYARDYAASHPGCRSDGVIDGAFVASLLPLANV